VRTVNIILSLRSGGSGQVSELLVAAKVAAANKLLSQCS